MKEQTEIIMGEIYPKLEKGKKIEVTPEICQFGRKLRLNIIYGEMSKNVIEQGQPNPAAQGKNGGLVRQPVKDGGGYTHFEWLFAGNARKAQDGGMWSDTCDAEADPKLSLGSNNRAIEATLRRHKDKLNYKEPERRGGVRHHRGR